MVVTPNMKPFLLSTDYIMNYASDVTGVFTHGNMHIKMLKLLKLLKRFSFPLLKTYYAFLDNAEGHTPHLNMGCQVQTGQIQKEESICALTSSSCTAQVLQLIGYTGSAMLAEVP